MNANSGSANDDEVAVNSGWSNDNTDNPKLFPRHSLQVGARLIWHALEAQVQNLLLVVKGDNQPEVHPLPASQS
jgi:hypothetical protein